MTALGIASWTDSPYKRGRASRGTHVGLPARSRELVFSQSCHRDTYVRRLSYSPENLREISRIAEYAAAPFILRRLRRSRPSTALLDEVGTLRSVIAYSACDFGKPLSRGVSMRSTSLDQPSFVSNVGKIESFFFRRRLLVDEAWSRVWIR